MLLWPWKKILEFPSFESFLEIFYIRVLKYFQKSCNPLGYEKRFQIILTNNTVNIEAYRQGSAYVSVVQLCSFQSTGIYLNFRGDLQIMTNASSDATIMNYLRETLLPASTNVGYHWNLSVRCGCDLKQLSVC